MSNEQVDQKVLEAVRTSDQTHLLADWNNLTAGQRAGLTSDIQVQTGVKRMHDDTSCMRIAHASKLLLCSAGD